MKIVPMKKYKTPAYPDLQTAANNPDLLKKLPSRWENSAAVKTAIAGLAAISLCGCSQRAGSVAPIFEHGAGTGSLGCVMVAPPVFMSEQEAMAVIRKEAAAAGITLDDTPDSSGLGAKLEASDEARKIAVVFISKDDARVTPDVSSVTSYNMKKRAELTAKKLEGNSGKYHVGVFYDPGADSDEYDKILNRYLSADDRSASMSQYEEEVKAYHEENLRAQVKDFIEWLRGEGII